MTGDGNRLLSDGTYNYEYDNEGNLIKQTEIATGEVREFTWDYRNRLVAMVDKDTSGNITQQLEFTYDVLDRRIAKTVDDVGVGIDNAPVQWFIYNGDDVHLEFTDNDGVAGANQPILSQRYLHGPFIDQILAQEDGNGNVTWMLTDHLGTVRDLVDNSGSVVNHLVYDSFGRVIAETNPSVDTRYLYTGREFDEETGLYYYRARYYDASVGRFISEDAIGFGGRDVNLYRYVVNETISFVDPFGEGRGGKKNVNLSPGPRKQAIDNAIQQSRAGNKVPVNEIKGTLNKAEQAYLKTQLRNTSFGSTGRPFFGGLPFDPLLFSKDITDAIEYETDPQKREELDKKLENSPYIRLIPGCPIPIIPNPDYKPII